MHGMRRMWMLLLHEGWTFIFQHCLHVKRLGGGGLFNSFFYPLGILSTAATLLYSLFEGGNVTQLWNWIWSVVRVVLIRSFRVYPAASARDMVSYFFNTKWYLYTSARCKQPSGKYFRNRLVTSSSWNNAPIIGTFSAVNSPSKCKTIYGKQFWTCYYIYDRQVKTDYTSATITFMCIL